MIAPAITQSTPRSNVNADHRVIDLADLLDFLDDYNPNLSSAHVGLGDYNMDGYVDLSDQLDFLGFWMPDLGVATGRDVLTAGEGGGRAHGGNRKGYAAYEHEPWWHELTPSGTPPTEVPDAEAGPLMQLARHRFYRADLGTWTRRDPLGYVDGPGLYGYVTCRPLQHFDSRGLCLQNANQSNTSHDSPEKRQEVLLKCQLMFPSLNPNGGNDCTLGQIKLTVGQVPWYLKPARIAAVANCRDLGNAVRDGARKLGAPAFEQNRCAHCVVACCLARSIGQNDAETLLVFRECCTIMNNPGSDPAWEDYWDDMRANKEGIDAKDSPEHCMDACKCN